MEYVLLFAIAIGCALVCALSVYWMKYQADTIKNLEGQLEGSKAQLQMILDNERSKHQIQIQTPKTSSSDKKVPIFQTFFLLEPKLKVLFFLSDPCKLNLENWSKFQHGRLRQVICGWDH